MVTRLSPEHASALAASGISPDVIAARGYWTAHRDETEVVRRLGHSSEIVAHGSALMIPLHDVHGAIALTVARPDAPRVSARGKDRKYEIPRGGKATLDVPPGVRGALGDAEIGLWIVEGQKKADAAASAGAGCVISVLGVWNRKHHAIAAWEAVRLRDRAVYLAFDSDAATNPKVSTALRRLRASWVVGVLTFALSTWRPDRTGPRSASTTLSLGVLRWSSSRPRAPRNFGSTSTQTTSGRSWMSPFSTTRRPSPRFPTWPGQGSTGQTVCASNTTTAPLHFGPLGRVS